MGKISKVFSLVCVLLIILGIYFSALFVLNGDIIFHTDIARDFMLMQQVVESHKFTLIGPRIGPVPGLFHGPLWLYLNLPAFILGHGNPVVVGWGWVIMGILFLFSTYFAVNKIFGRNPALLATVFLSSRLAFYSHQLFNPSGAIMLTPIFFYTYWKYFESKQPKYLIFLSIILGCLIQFEAAYGVPITILVITSIIISSLKSRRFSHPLYLLAILLPLSSYLLFDLRHDFLQLHAITNYLQSSGISGSSILETLKSRSEFIINSGYGFILPPNISWEKTIYLFFFLAILAYGVYFGGKRSLPYWLYLYLFGGYWLLSLFYRGVFESYYYQPLQILTLIIVSSSLSLFPSIIALLLLSFPIFSNLAHSKVASFATYDYSGNHASSWQYNLNLAKSLYEKSPGDFGYFVLSEDLLAYSPKYAIIYANYLYPNKKSSLFQKKPTTYVIISSDTYKQGSIDVRWWEEGQVRITKKPEMVTDYRGNYTIKEYLLTEDEIKIPEDPNLMH